MTKREIPSDAWPNFMDEFSRLHQGKEAEVTVVDRTKRADAYAHAAPLLGIVDEHHGRADEAIELMLGDLPDGALSHTMPHPSRVEVTEWNDAYSAQLDIESSDGQRMVIQVGPREEVLPPGVIMDGVQLE
jgi:hypothetical protein